MNPARKRAYIELLLVAAIWGIAAPIIKYTLSGFSPAVFLTYRLFISAIMSVIIFLITGIKFPKSRKVLLVTIFNGFLLTTVSLGLLFFGLEKTTSIDSNLISAMSPILIAIAGVFFLKEHITKRESVGILIALSGTVITIIEPVLHNSAGGFGGLEGNLLVLASVLVGTITAILTKLVLRDDVDPSFSSNMSFIIGFITILPFSISTFLSSGMGVITNVPFRFHLGVFYMALLSGTLAYFLWHKAEKTIEVGEVNLIGYLYPVFGTPISILWLGEKVDLMYAIGCTVIIAGVVLAEWKKRKYSTPKNNIDNSNSKQIRV